MTETPKITYVRGRGLAEVSRLIFAAKDIEIDEEYITSKAEFEKLRTTGKLMFMQLPLVEIDGLCLIESQAQEHYLGQKYNMIGSNDKEMGNVYMLYTGARSFQILCQPTWIIFHPEEKWDDCRKEAVKKARERYLPPYEKVLTENGTGFLVGSSVTIADCALFNILSYIDEGADYGNLLDEFPRCKSFVTTFSAIPGVKKYLDSPRRFPPPDKEYAAEALAILF
ncbi:glutathione S-transferase [Apostichopus japonicus]|uniref:Glutathione S-transferase n=1 Tax=Stichopus japonicus TaxID=307972 RepID=A0A2G8K387_STIJA|nr:glutathione S-transferase [Apostichopus japonicus]